MVAIGAAIQADILVGNKPDSEMLLLDVIPLCLETEAMGGTVEKSFRATPLLSVARARGTPQPSKDGRTAMSIHVMQGEARTGAEFAVRWRACAARDSPRCRRAGRIFA